MGKKQSNYVVSLLAGVTMVIIFGTFSPLALIIVTYSAFAVGETQQVWQPDIKASDIYQYYTMVLGKDIKNLVILIPDEGHEILHRQRN